MSKNQSNNINKTISGTEFNILYKDVNFVKLTSEDENHNDLQFHDGLNEDILPFYPHGACHAGGIYFIDEKVMKSWIYYNMKFMVYVRSVQIPDDAQVYIENNKFKTDKIILGSRQNISEETYIDAIINYCVTPSCFPQHILTKKICLTLMKHIAYPLSQIPHNLKDKELCMEGVKLCGLSLLCVPVELRDREICMEAVKQSCHAIHYIPKDMIDAEMKLIAKC